MALHIIAKSDLQQAAGGKPDEWESTGDDPAFHVVLPIRRNPHLVLSLACAEEDIDPKVYVDRGFGFREKDAVAIAPGRTFLIQADVGRYGLIRALRVDPASFPTRLTFDARAFRTATEAQAYAKALAAGTQSHAGMIDLGRLPRLKLPVPRLSFGRRTNSAARYAEACYALAEAQAQTTRMPPAGDVPPWLSIVVPVYNAPARYLDDLVQSFLAQKEAGAELILSDDASTSRETRQWLSKVRPQTAIRIIRNTANGGIAQATNAGLSEASGRWVTLLDHDDVIAPHALRLVREALARNPDTLFLYTDELVVDDALLATGLMLKPAYDPVLLTGVNYINHFSFYRRDRLAGIGNLRTGYDGSQDYDLLLRYLEGIARERVLHLPYPAYWWRRTGHTYSRKFLDAATKAARTAIADRFAREGVPVRVEGAITETLHRVLFDRAATGWPRLSVIIPSRNGYDLISRVLNDLFEKTDYPALEVIVVDNGTTDTRVLDLYASYAARFPAFSAHVEPDTFNFARAINKGISLASGEHYLILNNDIEVIEPGWLKEMVSCLAFSGTGVVGAKLLYPNGRIQHAGVIAGFGGLAGHWYLNKSRNFGGPLNRLHLRNSMTCVTGAAMLLSGDCVRITGAWDETSFAVAYNDVDYCLRAHKAGFNVVWTPFACLYHHESASRGSDLSGERRARFEREKRNLQCIHNTETFLDPAINPAYDRRHSDPAVLIPGALHPERFWR
jgi:GT2 family glycosyltransferase